VEKRHKQLSKSAGVKARGRLGDTCMRWRGIVLLRWEQVGHVSVLIWKGQFFCSFLALAFFLKACVVPGSFRNNWIIFEEPSSANY
jgi:hypothetical protein